MARRFIVNENDLKMENNKLEIFGKEVKHIQVLRHNIGDVIIVNQYDCKILKMHSHSIELEIIENTKSVGVPTLDVTLYMGMLKNEKMDFVIQKAVEIGVSRIIPFFSRNVVVKLDEKSREKRIEKMRVIANEACKQCGRTDYVKVEDFVEFKNITNLEDEYDVCMIAYENDNTSLKNVISGIKNSGNVKKVAIFIGAEGGFDKTEIESFLNNNKNVCTVSLGTRILRAETAALNLLSIIMYELD